MTTIATPPISGDRGAVPTEARDPRTGSRMWSSRLIGALFLAGFVIYGTGSILVDFAAHAAATDRRLWSEDRIHANSDGHARIAEALAHALHLPGSSEAWKQPLPPVAEQTRRQWWAAEARWIGRHLLPWAWQGVTRRSSADGRAPKRPELAPL